CRGGLEGPVHDLSVIAFDVDVNPAVRIRPPHHGDSAGQVERFVDGELRGEGMMCRGRRGPRADHADRHHDSRHWMPRSFTSLRCSRSWLSSRHATSSSSPFGLRLSGIAIVHGRVNTTGSLTVASYWIMFALTGVNRSTTLAARVLTSPTSFSHVLPFRFVVSTTSVSPSQRPSESPCQSRIVSGRCARPSSGMMRHDMRSSRITTYVGVWMI